LLFKRQLTEIVSFRSLIAGGSLMSVQILQGDCRDVLRTLADESVNCVVTSPPYFGLRDYGCEGQIGLEVTPDAFVTELVSVFREVRRVLRADGTCWLNLGDSYVSKPPGNKVGIAKDGDGLYGRKLDLQVGHGEDRAAIWACGLSTGLPNKSLIGMPWRVALALQADGWILRQDIIWSKPNPMPESVQDRCTKAHEYVFLLSKSPRYYYDADAIAEPVAPSTVSRLAQDVESQQGSDRVPGKTNGAMKAVGRTVGVGSNARPSKAVPNSAVGRAAGNKSHKYVDQYEAEEGEQHRTKAGLMKIADVAYSVRNARSVWNIATQPFSEAHFATFPPELAERCIKAGCPEGGMVLDPFFGAGTTGLVADRLRRSCIGIELNPAYAEIARNRISKDAGMFAEVSA